MLTSTAYHPQTDEQSERTNQTIEIALRYFLTSHLDENWSAILPYLQFSINNATSVVTGQSSNEIVYGFKVNDSLSLLNEQPVHDFIEVRSIRRQKTQEAIDFAAASAKYYYDKTHKFIELESGSKAYLRLHKGYTIPGLRNRKLSNQRAGSFLISNRVGKLAYRLKLSSIMRIHPVISIAQLEPFPSGTDPYNRTPEKSSSICAEHDLEPIYEIERLLDKRMSRNKIQYLIK